MTNGEKIKEVFPNAEINYGLRGVVAVTFIHKTIFDLDWWNAEYQEPTTKIRPKGHWIDHSDEGYVECPKCGSATNCDGNINDLHFCFSCGAEMESEVEE